VNCAVYIISNPARTLYIGVTSNLLQRMYQHKQGLIDGFSKRYHLHALVYFEQTTDINVAIEREKQLKGWRRARKIELIEAVNPGWVDRAQGWYR
jgi:putative endonuclease